MTAAREQARALAERFPAGFAWGAATAAYQIEGSTSADGRRASIWDVFSRTPGRTRNGESGDPACDHYARWRSDIDLMVELNLNAYRFSVAWPRIQPDGRGAVNEAGLGFYERLVDGLLERGIEPWLTLYHWDLPQALEEAGGWPDREIVGRFAEYARIVVERLGDRVRRWITLNEPRVFTIDGYALGRHAPGRTEWPAALRATHHAHLAHRAAAEAIRDRAPDAEIGIALNLTHVEAASADPVDAGAARMRDGAANRWWLDPLFGRGYPADVAAAYGSLLDGVDLTEIGAGSDPDFIGVNYYHPDRVAAPTPERPAAGPLAVVDAPGARPRTSMGWEVDSSGLAALLDRLWRDYRPRAIAVTENGAAYEDAVSPAGTVEDRERVDYLEQHLGAVAAVIERKIPVVGYFAWSLLDNFEWAEGYSKRFGITYVDYPTQRRIVKASGRWYAALAAAAGSRP